MTNAEEVNALNSLEAASRAYDPRLSCSPQAVVNTPLEPAVADAGGNQVGGYVRD